MHKDMDYILMMSVVEVEQVEEVMAIVNNRFSFIRINMRRLIKIIINYMNNILHYLMQMVTEMAEMEEFQMISAQ